MLYKGKYILKQLEDDDLQGVKELFLKGFKKDFPLTYLKNKYETSYTGLKYICSIAYENTNPVAFYGAIPQKFSNNETTIFVAHACDSFTLKSCQGQGLHFQLAKLSYDIMRQHDIKFVYAFHSQNTYYSTKKLDWEEYLNLQRFHITVPTIPIAKVVNKLNCNNNYTLLFNKKLDSGAINSLRKFDSGKFQQCFTNHFFEYKNSMNNHYFIKLDDCVFWIKIEAIMLIGSFYAPSKKALYKAIQKLKLKAFFLGITEILFQLHPYSTMALQLKDIVTPKESWLVGYLSFDPNINIHDFLFSYADLDTF